MVRFEFNIHSVIDIITNSSSELFVFEAKAGDMLKDLISSVHPDYLTEYRDIERLSDLSDESLLMDCGNRMDLFCQQFVHTDTTVFCTPKFDSKTNTVTLLAELAQIST